MDILLEEESIVVAFGIIIALSVYYSPVNHTQSYEDFYFKISQESSILFIILYSIARFLAAQNVLDVSLVGKFPICEISENWLAGQTINGQMCTQRHMMTMVMMRSRRSLW